MSERQSQMSESSLRTKHASDNDLSEDVAFSSFEVTEDLPSMRAVSLRSEEATIQFSSKVIRKNPGWEHSDAAASISFQKKKRTTKGSATKTVRTSHTWDVSSLAEVPLDFPLERTRREIVNSSAAEVANRTSRSLCRLSIDAIFDGENAIAKCKTSDMVKFQIRLFASKRDNHESVTIEIQRRSGDQRRFIQTSRKILDAAEGKEIDVDRVVERKKIPPFLMKRPIRAMKCLQDVAARDPCDDAHKGIQRSLKLLRSKEKYFHVMGFENLCFITHSLKTRPEVASICCKELLFGQYASEIQEEIEEKLQRDSFLTEEYKGHICNDLDEKCHHLTLILLSNIFETTSVEGCLTRAILEQKWFTDYLIPALLNELMGFESSANSSFEAVCSLKHMATCSDLAVRILNENSTVQYLEDARDYAVFKHDLLAIEAKRLLDLLA